MTTKRIYLDCVEVCKFDCYFKLVNGRLVRGARGGPSLRLRKPGPEWKSTAFTIVTEWTYWDELALLLVHVYKTSFLRFVNCLSWKWNPRSTHWTPSRKYSAVAISLLCFPIDGRHDPTGSEHPAAPQTIQSTHYRVKSLALD